MLIDQSRAMSATLPSKWTGDAFEAVIMRPDCSFWNHRAPVLQYMRPERFPSGNEAVTHDREGGACSQATSGTLVGVFEHFTDNARRVLVLAQEEARDLHASSIDPVHLLLGMVREGDSIAAKALSAVGADYYLAREIIEDDDAQESELRSASQPFSIATMRIIEKSVKISWDRADGGIDTEHLLVALLEAQDDAIEDVLAGLDVTPKRSSSASTPCWPNRILWRTRCFPRSDFRSAVTGASGSNCLRASCGVSITLTRSLSC